MTAQVSEYRAWRVHQTDDGFVGREEVCQVADLPAGEVLIRVNHSSLNYKDALSAAGNKGVTRQYPHTPGIDAAGLVVESATPEFAPGDAVIVTGYDLGMNSPGGFGEYIRVPAGWVVPLPADWSSRLAMVYGTAGLTAGLCVDKLLQAGLKPGDGPVLVTGASGAVGSIATELLAKLGYEVVAMTGKADKHDWLKSLGATSVIGRESLAAQPKPMLKTVYAGGVDTVGGDVLAEFLKQVQPGGSVACCGLVAGAQLNTTVLPFILRGVNLLGVDSVEIERDDKAAIWQLLSGDWACPGAEGSFVEIGRDGLATALKAFLGGSSAGKVVLDHARS